MSVFLTGVGCVVKTTVDLRLAELMGLRFFDLDTEIELFFGMLSSVIIRPPAESGSSDQWSRSMGSDSIDLP